MRIGKLLDQMCLMKVCYESFQSSREKSPEWVTLRAVKFRSMLGKGSVSSSQSMPSLSLAVSNSIQIRSITMSMQAMMPAKPHRQQSTQWLQLLCRQGGHLVLAHSLTCSSLDWGLTCTPLVSTCMATIPGCCWSVPGCYITCAGGA